ncbi:DUF742 domain-containing protein [Streptomyces massasporeus]|uniref:DUF742 domain-containing protein n=1 Tax=Streptomyces massasporeus TaxID=67324 RepID=UPI0036E9FF66
MASSTRRSWTSEPAEAPAHFVLTGGQTRPRHDLRVETLLTAQDPAPTAGTPIPEAERALALCRGQPSSVAEIAALPRWTPFRRTRRPPSNRGDGGQVETGRTCCLPRLVSARRGRAV